MLYSADSRQAPHHQLRNKLKFDRIEGPIEARMKWSLIRHSLKSSLPSKSDDSTNAMDLKALLAVTEREMEAPRKAETGENNAREAMQQASATKNRAQYWPTHLPALAHLPTSHRS